jgi:tryptophan halogenase
LQADRIKKIVIVGGGTAGWMTAAAFVRHLGVENCSIRLVESDMIMTVGVGEATIPAIREFNHRLGLDEPEFMRATNASIKSGIQFENWGDIGESYIHAFGYYGTPINDIPFQHFWLKMREMGDTTSFNDYCMPHVASELGRFAFPSNDPASVLSRYFYAFHFDATLYAQYLRGWSEERGVERTEGKVVDTTLNGENGFIESITLDSGEIIEGELFVDCSGFRGLLIEQALKTGYKDWSHYLPCNSAFAISTAYEDETTPIPPFTRARALPAGWQWRIPLQNRTGDGHVFCDEYMSHDEATAILLENIEGKPISEPRLLRFTTGMRNKVWNKNCVSIGLSGGFLEPLESTSIYLIQTAILKFIRSFPDKNFDPVHTDEYNRQMSNKYVEARDFLVLHYHATKRDDTPFWDYCRNMKIPGELKRRIAYFRNSGAVSFQRSELFIEHNWLAVLVGQGIIPERYDPRIDGINTDEIKNTLLQMRTHIRQQAEMLPVHAKTLADYCKGELLTRHR